MITIDDQIKFIQHLDNSGLKMAVLATLKLWKKHFPKVKDESVLVGMSMDEYKSFEEFKQFLKFKNKQL